MGGAEGVPCPPQHLACQHIYGMSIVFVNAVMLMKHVESPISLVIGLERSLLVSKLGFYTPPAIFFSFAPDRLPIMGMLITRHFISF